MTNCLFCDFTKGKRDTHRGGKPFTPIYSTKHSLVFMSIDPPTIRDDHLLVIPKKHYESVEDIPKNEASDLIELVQLSMRVLRNTYPAANILQNNGKEAGQYIFHVHFHLIPRDKDDGIEIEIWEHRDVDPQIIDESSRRLRYQFEKLKTT